MSKFNQVCRLPDGRLLGYDEYGAVNGTPIFYFHGTPSTRHDWLLFGSDEIARKLGLRLIAVDRPGIGLSSFQPNRQILDWPRDVCFLADHLAIDQFAVISHSGGSPYAAACAYLIPERLTNVTIVSGAAPINEPTVLHSIAGSELQLLKLAQGQPWLLKISLPMLGLTAHYAPAHLFNQMMLILPKSDRKIITKPDKRSIFASILDEIFHSPRRGAALDTNLLLSEWGFQLQDIKIPVQLWHGNADRDVPVAMGHYLAENIPNCYATFYPDEGHLSLFANRLEEILTLTVKKPQLYHAA